jgi:hypothetical protein
VDTAAAAAAVLTARAAQGLASGSPRSTARLGVAEVGWGVFYVLAVWGGFAARG